MGRPWEYPRWRRVLMQAVMWLIFGGSLGLAQLISAHSRNAVEAIGTQVQIDGFQVRLPEDWSMRPLDLQGADSVKAQGVEAVDPEARRVLQVVVLPLRPVGPMEGLGIGAASSHGQRIDFTGLRVTGTMRMQSSVRQLRQGETIMERTITATASVPPDHIILIQLVVPGSQQIGRADARLVRDIASGITAAPASPDTDDDEDGGP